MKYHHTITAILLAGLTTGVSAQSAENFQSVDADNVDSTQQIATDTRTTLVDKEAETELLASPSRYAGLDIENYIHALSSSFSMRKRDLDPFARHQDPNFKPVQPTIARNRTSAPKKEVVPFSDIISRIKLTAVMPAEQTFLAEGNTFRIGSRIPLDVGKEQPIYVHVVAIQRNSVTFRHSVTSEIAKLTLGLAVPGIRPGTNELPPGLKSPDSIAPLGALPINPISSRR